MLLDNTVIYYFTTLLSIVESTQMKLSTIQDISQ